MDNLPIIDIAIAVILLISAFLAYARGFVHEVLSIGGWVGAILIAIYGYPHVQPHIRDYVPSDQIALIAAAAIVFVISLIVLSLLTSAISSRVQNSALNALDRSLGFLFGLVRGAVLVCLIYMAVEWLIPKEDQPPWMSSARAMPLVETGADWLKMLIPEDTSNAGAKALKNAEEKARLIEESRQILEGLIAPKPKSGDTGAQEGYGDKIRTEMERLIESSSGK
ncbi:MAG: CvpA family protein [Rhodospirillaceae bacterium]|jgi:membrane protein required for colicin V production|nr:CvpA family protein [Rhodospirillaceae bacterium]MBT4218530.1 CvpA family protein [Rhodospirillaceae bacterium]MBT4464527.1 CvpA family protein [Rhodospirillaceae bacterium]MBT5013486.1 CvpA family protein [Rhodospirillaceae bacterium]MBT5308972.1 CvpA family protein [Rhodospirillaceae bacterium]